jgi:type VI secretion system protein
LDIPFVQPHLDINSSIREHLIQLLNARQGSLQHLPDYGLKDLGEIYQGLPYSLQDLKLTISQLIEKYEPRLINVKIIHQPIQDNDTVLHLEIHAQLRNQQKILFDTYFLSGGKVKIGKTQNG